MARKSLGASHWKALTAGNKQRTRKFAPSWHAQTTTRRWNGATVISSLFALTVTGFTRNPAAPSPFFPATISIS